MASFQAAHTMRPKTDSAPHDEDLFTMARRRRNLEQVMTWGPGGSLVPLKPEVILNPRNVQRPETPAPAEGVCPQFQNYIYEAGMFGGGAHVGAE